MTLSETGERQNENGRHNKYTAIFEESVSFAHCERLSGVLHRLSLIHIYYWTLKEYSQNQFFFLNADTCDSYPLPDDRDTVVEVTLEETEE